MPIDFKTHSLFRKWRMSSSMGDVDTSMCYARWCAGRPLVSWAALVTRDIGTYSRDPDSMEVRSFNYNISYDRWGLGGFHCMRRGWCIMYTAVCKN